MIWRFSSTLPVALVNLKGVMVTFGALSANLRLIHNGFYRTMENNGLKD
eukprot:CAMPEP_0168718324 /NCGR_PEP_ID=MMETSP0724-20121128/457_1 /TAXON_ID=265536 /ORGANISM="Amphiprora sp., Strain CCMP467" /LENGTH=48 /DNA_ID= /DNA_START= /DNA_END= /DNA_ORIENTATION=